MRLADYLTAPERTATDLALKCRVAVSTITRAAKGKKAPSLGLMREIAKATNGAVMPNDFLPDPAE